MIRQHPPRDTAHTTRDGDLAPADTDRRDSRWMQDADWSALRLQAKRRSGGGVDPAGLGDDDRHPATVGAASGRLDPTAPAFRRAGAPDGMVRGDGRSQDRPEHGAPRDDAHDGVGAGGGRPWVSDAGDPAFGARDGLQGGLQRAAQDGTTTRAARLGHGVLGAGWIGGDLSALDHAIHPDACLRTGLVVATGPGAAMAAALADLGRYENLAYFAENTLCSETASTDLCPHALAAMGMDRAPADGVILSLRGSLTGRMAPGVMMGAKMGAATPDAPHMRQRLMADLWCAGGQVRDGWILHDSGGALAQAGGPHPADWARDRLRAAGGPDRMPPPLTPDTDPDGPYVARSPLSRRCDWGEALADRLRRIMDGDLATLDHGSDPACDQALPGGVTGLGPRPARLFWAGLRAALPSAAFRIEHRHGAARPHEAPQAAVRWSLYGRHDGPGRFGAPTGCFLHVAGMTQVEFGPFGVRRDWTVIDDCAVWTQIVMATGNV